jgi:hypothetical protein
MLKSLFLKNLRRYFLSVPCCSGATALSALSGPRHPSCSSGRNDSSRSTDRRPATELRSGAAIMRLIETDHTLLTVHQELLHISHIVDLLRRWVGLGAHLLDDAVSLAWAIVVRSYFAVLEIFRVG